MTHWPGCWKVSRWSWYFGMHETRFVILTEGGGPYGFGHVARCSALYQAFIEAGCNGSLMINGDAAVARMLEGIEHGFGDWRRPDERLAEIIADAAVTIVDSYVAGPEDYERVAGRARKVVYIDDNARLPYAAGVLVNGTNFTHLLSFDGMRPTERLLGSQYIMIRRAFWDREVPELKVDVQRIFVSIGGGDRHNLTPDLVRAVQEAIPQGRYDVVVTQAFGNKAAIHEQLDANGRIIESPSMEEMVELMTHADLALTACGQTLYEFMRLGVPAIGLAVSDNQIKCGQALHEDGYLREFLVWPDEGGLSRLNSALEDARPLDRRRAIRRSGQQIVDGQGARRIVEYLLNG